MRTVYYTDVAAAARVLLGRPVAERAQLCAVMVQEAQSADRFVRRIGRLHPQWGNGTLLAAARRRRLSPERSLDDAEYNACFKLVLDAVICKAS